MKIKLGFIRVHKLLYGKDKTKMYNLTPAVFLGLMEYEEEKDWIVGIDWLLWSLYIQISKLKHVKI